MIDLFFENLNSLRTAFMIVGFFSAWLYNRSTELGHLTAVSLAAAVIPTGVSLLIVAFDTGRIDNLDFLGFHLALAGLSLLYVSWKGIHSQLSAPA